MGLAEVVRQEASVEAALLAARGALLGPHYLAAERSLARAGTPHHHSTARLGHRALLQRVREFEERPFSAEESFTF